MHFKTIWISDVHLGMRYAKAEELSGFLKRNTCDTLYLVGDIVDGWRLKQKFYWSKEYTDVVRKILSKSKKGTNVIYIPGNHDEFLRNFLNYNLQLDNIIIKKRYIHTTVDNKKLLVLHGDEFDGITRYYKFVAYLGDFGYNCLLGINRWFNFARQKLGFGYWSLSAFLKWKVKQAINFIYEFEHAVSVECKKRNLDGAICGHIHNPEIKKIENITYYNCGDWIESKTALVEHMDGTMELVYYDSLN